MQEIARASERARSPENVHVCVNRAQGTVRIATARRGAAVRGGTRNGDFIVPSLGRVSHGGVRRSVPRRTFVNPLRRRGARPSYIQGVR